ncbi:MAG: hypothetical protein GXO58_06150 [Thermodesulfobacteria bacterium]|nr:hypothetical protein [Thermodesulfobacteriota bacterium]
MMTKTSLISRCFILLSIFFSLFPAVAKAAGISIGSDAESAYLDVNGLWDFNTYDYSVIGTCPPGNPASGTISITHDANSSSLTLVFLTGMTCSPESACIYRGSFQTEKNIVVSNSLADTSGGTISNTISLTWTSDTSAYGTGVSVYNFSNGVSCTWNYKLSLKRNSGSDRTGWWYDKDALGSGISIEIQNGNLFMGWYTYDTNGNPIWMTSYGSVTNDTFSGTLYKWHGWYLEDSYQIPIAEPVGTVNLDLLDANTTIFNWTYNGLSGNSTMVRFMDAFAPGERDPRNIHGWWYCPTMDGMGLFMEAQADVMFLTWYNYDIFGEPLWWTASDTFRPTDTTFVATLKEWHDGQCPGCPYQMPVAFDKATVIVEFLSDSTANLVWKGNVFKIKRFVF